MMNIKEIVKKWLEDNNYDGLYDEEECGCELADLMSCDEPSPFCRPGYKTNCDCNDDAEDEEDREPEHLFHIGPNR